MRVVVFALMVAGMVLGLVAGQGVNTLSEQERADGWRLLWDGKSSEGWRSTRRETFPEKGWTMDNGELTVLPKSAGGGGGDIITKEKFSNYILKLEFKLTKAANSGLKYMYDPKLHKGTTMEYQVLDIAHPDAKAGRDGNRQTASLYDVLPAKGAEPKAAGEWNSAMLVCKGMHVEHWLNGVKVLEFERGSEEFRAAVALSKFKEHKGWGEQESGHILLQDHSDRVSYRNIKIKVLE